MRLALFRKLTPKRQKEEVEKVKKEIVLAYKEMCRLGTWNPNVTKELKEKGEAILWQART